jgi:hypothetical protein
MHPLVVKSVHPETLSNFRSAAKQTGLTQAALLGAMVQLWNTSPKARERLVKLAFAQWMIQAAGGPYQVIKKMMIAELESGMTDYESLVRSGSTDEDTLAAIRGINERTRARIEQIRISEGPFSTLPDATTDD